MDELAKQLKGLTEAGLFDALSEAQWRAPYAPGKWTRAEVLGHLIDSAAHNHQRFARALHQDALTAPGYEGDNQVRVQNYRHAPIPVLVDAWSAYNRLIAFVIAQIPPGKLETWCTIASFAPMTLRELAEDYVAHLEHHLRQILLASFKDSGLPWPPPGRW